MKKCSDIFIKKCLSASRSGLIGFVLLALIGAGASSAARLWQAPSSLDQDRPELITQSLITPDPSDTEPLTEKMAGGSTPNGEPSAILSQFNALGQLSQTSLERELDPESQILLGPLPKTKLERPLGSTSLISSSLGRQFTLVGAKPSGTG